VDLRQLGHNSEVATFHEPSKARPDISHEVVHRLRSQAGVEQSVPPVLQHAVAQFMDRHGEQRIEVAAAFVALQFAKSAG
jgi:hypothetical protein